MDLFDHLSQPDNKKNAPLAERIRPRTLNEFVGQTDVVGPGTLLATAIEKDTLFSMLFWGPPGCGKTTLANIIARETHSHFMQISAVLSGVKDIKAIIDTAKQHVRHSGKKTILFVDEIHRFNKAQQDAFLKHVENGLITLIGATTENPSFEVIPALLSRCRIFVLKALATENIRIILERALSDTEDGLGDMKLEITADALDYLADIADGDVRSALNGLETVASFVRSSKSATGHPKPPLAVTLSDIEHALQRKALMYDKSGEEHFNLISALHKSLRGSDPDAAAYWLMRMIESGEDPLYIGRRMVRFASEDIGNADPNALTVALNAVEAFRFLGHPEGDLSLLQAAVYLATAPKSNSLYMTLNNVKKAIGESGSLPVPFHIRNAPTKLMKNLGYGKNYKYPHDYKDAYVPEDYLPDQLKGKIFYSPNERGYEKTIKRWLEGWRKLKEKKE